MVKSRKKICKKKYFQGIHDRFIRDPEFRGRMIENHRDEELGRRWGCSCGWRSHSPFVYTRILSLQDLISNKHCLPCIDCNKKQKKTHKCLLIPTQVNNGHKVLLPHGGIGKVHGGLLILPKVTMEMHQVLNERCDLLIAACGKILRDKTFHEFNLLRYRWIVYSWQRSAVTDGGCKHNTSKWPVFRVQKVCNKWLQERIDDHNMQSEYKYKSGLQSENSVIGYVCVVTLHDYTTDTNDNMTTKADFHTEHINMNTWLRSLVLVESAYRHTSHCTVWPSPSCVRHFTVIHMRSWCVRFSLDIDLSFLFIICLSHLLSHLRFVANMCTPPKRVWTLLTRPTPSQVMSPTPTTSRRLTSSPTQSSWPHRRSPSKGFPRTPSTMTPHSRICCVKLTENMSITLNCWVK